jgi:hypothetical protein
MNIGVEYAGLIAKNTMIRIGMTVMNFFMTCGFNSVSSCRIPRRQLAVNH